jgi:hypothetical protein
MNNYSLSALLAAGLLVGSIATGAQAADLGGDCCADLEERVAELEATTARKGNRKVSLTISGFVAQQVMWWDDGNESNVYVTDTGSIDIGTNFSFSGVAQINSEWSAGFLLKLEVMNNDSLLVTQNSDDTQNALALVQGDVGGLVGLQSANWFLKSERLGKVTVGQGDSAANNQAILPDGSGSLVQANYVFYDVNAFVVRANGAYVPGVVWGFLGNCSALNAYGGAMGDCDGVPTNNVRYDTPTFGGFSGSVSWGEDDIWALSARYAGEFRDFKLAAAIAYQWNTDETGTSGTALAPVPNFPARNNGGLDVRYLQTGAYLEHAPSGLWIYGAAGWEDNDVTSAQRGFGRDGPEGDFWYLKTGLKCKHFALGSTTYYGEYGQKDDTITTFLFDQGLDTRVEHYGLGVVQNIDAAAMQVWLSWRHYQGDLNCDNSVSGSCASFGLNDGSNDLEDFDLIKMGALINF